MSVPMVKPFKLSRSVQVRAAHLQYPYPYTTQPNRNADLQARDSEAQGRRSDSAPSETKRVQTCAMTVTPETATEQIILEIEPWQQD